MTSDRGPMAKGEPVTNLRNAQNELCVSSTHEKKNFYLIKSNTSAFVSAIDL